MKPAYFFFVAAVFLLAPHVSAQAAQNLALGCLGLALIAWTTEP
jgi:hypothetical protein